MTSFSRYVAIALAFAVLGSLPTQAAQPESYAQWKCMLDKTRAAKDRGKTVSERQLRAICRAHAGDEEALVRPIEGGNPEIKKEFCQRYVADAFKYVPYGAQTCNLAGPGSRYSTYAEDHMEWCMSVPPQTATAESSARRDQVFACQFCYDYADLAIRQFQAKERCLVPPSNPSWIPVSYDEHISWCRMQQANRNEAETLRQMFIREGDLQKCGNKYGPQIAR